MTSSPSPTRRTSCCRTPRRCPADDEAAAYLVEKGYHSKETVDKFKKYHAIQRWKTQVGIQRIERTLVVAQPTLSYVFRMHGSYFVHVVLQCTHSRITEALVDRFQMLIDYMEVYARHDWSSSSSSAPLRPRSCATSSWARAIGAA